MGKRINVAVSEEQHGMLVRLAKRISAARKPHRPVKLTELVSDLLSDGIARRTEDMKQKREV